MTAWIVEAGDIVSGDYATSWTSRADAETIARALSRSTKWANCEIFVVADLGGGDRIGHRVFVNGSVVETKGLYDE